MKETLEHLTWENRKVKFYDEDIMIMNVLPSIDCIIRIKEGQLYSIEDLIM